MATNSRTIISCRFIECFTGTIEHHFDYRMLSSLLDIWKVPSLLDDSANVINMAGDLTRSATSCSTIFKPYCVCGRFWTNFEYEHSS